ncbi:hypothetical protein BC827DRAFT_685897 [Russula dissimulans]|nr:hypothetical protein BC827DRAFT_685897 [Russula dissimulans]
MTSDDMTVTDDQGEAWQRDVGPGSTVQSSRLFTQLNSEMFSKLIHHTSAILRRSHPFKSWPLSLHASRFSPVFRAHSWSGQSESANWNHLNDLYGKLAVNKPREPPTSANERWAMQSRMRTASLRPPKGPYAGRSVEVKNGNVAEALNKLQYTLQRNRVFSELRLTARHEKKGYKRRRLSSERWRRRFAHEVRKKVQLVNKIRARGA